MKLLIVEDNTDLDAIYARLFQNAGHEVHISKDGLSGLNDIADVDPDVILLDILMPEMDGYEFLQALKKITSIHPVVIVCSNLSEQGDIDQAIATGADFYMRKSDYVGAKLIKKVEELYASKTAEQQVPDQAS